MPEHAFTVAGSDGRPVRAVRHGPESERTVLLVHGFKGFKNWGWFPWIAERLVEGGLGAVRFDFSHNGVEERDFDRLDLFLLDTSERHQEDLHALAAAIPGRLGLMGHSRGGADAILFAASEPRVDALVTLASVSTTDFAPPEADAVLAERGYFPVPNLRTKQEMPVGLHALESGRRLDVEGAARSVDVPALCFHAEMIRPSMSALSIASPRGFPRAKACDFPGQRGPRLRRGASLAGLESRSRGHRGALCRALRRAPLGRRSPIRAAWPRGRAGPCG